MTNKRPDHISFSQLCLYERCPKAWSDKYLKGVEATKSLPLLVGSLVHLAVSKVNQYIIKLGNKEEMNIEEVVAIFDKTWKQGSLDFSQYERCKKMVLDEAERTFVNRAEILRVEYEVECQLKYKDQQTSLVGIIDRLDDRKPGIKIREYKTGLLLPSHEEVDEDLQGNIYTLLVHKTFPELAPIFFSRVSLGLGKEVMVEKDLTKLDGLEDYLIELWQKMATDKAFTPKLNQQCFYCPAKCDLYKKLLKEQLTEDLVTDTPSLVKAYLDAKAKAKMLKEQADNLKELVLNSIEEKQGDLEGADVSLTAVTKDRAGYTCEVRATSWQEVKAVPKYGKVPAKGKKEKPAFTSKGIDKAPAKW